MRSRREIPRGSQFVQWGVHKQASRIYRAVCATIIIIVVVVVIVVIIIYYMACVCRRYDARSDWLIVSSCNAHGPITGLRAHYRMQSDHFCCANFGLFCFIFVYHIIITLITSTFRSLRENLKPRPTVLTSLSLGQFGEASDWDFPVTTSLSVIKWLVLVLQCRLVFVTQ